MMASITVMGSYAVPIGSMGMNTNHGRNLRGFKALAVGFPSFLPKEIERIKDPDARTLAKRIERLPVQTSFTEKSIMSSCVKPLTQNETHPVVLLHGFDSSCLEWTYTSPLLEKAGLETWALDILGWGFSDLERLPSCTVASKREHLYQTSFTANSIMSSCVKPLTESETHPVVLLHGFDSSCLEWRYTSPLLEKAGLETWALDILGWGFSDLERLPSCNVASKREHLYQLWKSYIRKPMVLVGPSLGAAVAIDFAVNHPEAVAKLVLIDASVYTEGTGNLSKLPRTVAYAGVSLLKSFPLRLYANFLAFNSISFSTSLDWTSVGRLHCLLPWWEDATVDFMISGGYNVVTQIEQIKQKTLIIWGENDQIISNELATRLHREISNSIVHQIPDCGHLPHVEKPGSVAKLIGDFAQDVHSKPLESLVF